MSSFFSKLPLEADNRALSLDELHDMLQCLRTSRIVIRLIAKSNHVDGPSVALVGELRDVKSTDGGVSLTLDSPQQDTGGSVHMSFAALKETRMSTFDGNDFFILRLDWGDAQLLIQDTASGSAIDAELR